MAIIPQPEIFSWKSVEASPEIERLKRVIESIPDEHLIRRLEKERKGRRNEYPIRAAWNCLLAKMVFGHPTRAALIRELKRNAELRQVCGLDMVRAEEPVPPEWVFSRLGKKLIRHADLVQEIFDALLDMVAELLQDFGTNLAVDSKAIPVFGGKPEDADVGTKTYGDEKITWTGYKLHLLVDADSELPAGFEVTKASAGDSPRLMPLVDGLREDHPQTFERAQTLSADKAYDDGADKETLYDDRHILPVIPPRNMRKENEGLQALDPSRHDAIYFDDHGQLFCKVNPFDPDETKAFAPMQYMGFEKDRQTHKFRCPAAAWGVACNNRDACKCQPTVREGQWGRTVRVPLERDRRVFGPILENTRTFRKYYKKRTAVERVNSRLDNIFGLEHTYLRGLKRVRLEVSLILSVMLAVAASWIRMGKPQNIRRILRAA